MEKTNPPNAPQRISVISKAPIYAGGTRRFYAENPKREFAAIALDGKFIDWADAPVEQDGNILLVNGQPYRYERQRESRRRDAWYYYNDTYRLLAGWQVLLSSPSNPQPHPNLQYPAQDRSEAVETMRKYVTMNRSAYNSKMVGQVVWQERPGVYGDPVAICDGAEYTRHAAGQAILRGELLPFTWVDDEAEDAATPPASEDPPAKEEPVEDDTTDADSGQTATVPPPTIVLTVRYQGTGQAVLPTGARDGATCKLIDYADGRNNRPPDSNVKRLRDWLKECGYEPSFPEWKWLDKGHGPRRRREVYRLNGPATYDVVDHNLLRQYARENPIPRLGEEERRALYKRKALAGERHFEACPDCPKVQNCPHDWAACDRKAEWTKARRAEWDRPKLFVPGLIG